MVLNYQNLIHIHFKFIVQQLLCLQIIIDLQHLLFYLHPYNFLFDDIQILKTDDRKRT
jgi:hypothetical protein